MNTKISLESFGKNVVYVKSVDVADLPHDLQEQAGDHEQLFAVHNADGDQLALVADRQLAFALALKNDMRPVTVH